MAPDPAHFTSALTPAFTAWQNASLPAEYKKNMGVKYQAYTLRVTTDLPFLFWHTNMIQVI